jgi:hypothetical protein
MNLSLGIPVIILTTIVGSSVFGTLQSQVELAYKIGVGFISMLAALLAGMQTLFNFKEQSERHRITGVRLGALVRQLDQIRHLPFESRGDAKQFLDQIRKEWDTIQEAAPMISQYVWKNNPDVPQDIAGRKD